MGAPRHPETDLYPPVKQYLEAQGFEVKGEIASVDVVAVRTDEDPILVELKSGFSLGLFHQAIERQKITDWVYVAVPRREAKTFRPTLRSNIALCRRLGLGLITVRLRDGLCEVHVDPASYRPRKSPARRGFLLREFARRVGDPSAGGTRGPIMTAYRQDALRCLAVLAAGPRKAAEVAQASGVPAARRIMADDHYGWFARVSRGIYAATPRGEAARRDHADMISDLSS